VNSRGRAALAWFEDRGTSNDRVWVSLRAPGGSFGRPALVEQGRIRSVSVAVGQSDDVLVAWDARGVIRARYRAPRGRKFHAEETIRSEDAFSARIQTAVARNGRAYVAWTAQFRSEGGDSGPVFQQAAVKPAGSPRFRPAQLLERIDGVLVDQGALRIGLADTGATTAWTSWDGTHWNVRQSTTGQDATFGQAQTLSPAGEDAVLSALAVQFDGAAVALWDSGSETPRSAVRASFRPALGAFGAQEAVSREGDARFAVAAFDPQTRAPEAFWAQRSNPSSSDWTLLVAGRG
jgi:hypothetical protein